MQVHLSLDDQGEGPTTKIAGLPDTAARSDGARSGAQGGEFDSRLQIRVQLQDQFGSKVAESSPNSEGKIVFRTCSKVTYRLRAFGPSIEEIQLDNLVPGQGDKIMSLVLHHKNSQANRHSVSATVSASRLKVPRRANREFEKGNRDLAEGKLSQAQKHFERSIELYPQFDQAYNNLGVVLMRMDRPQDGKAAFEKAAQINDHFARAHLNLAKIALDAKDFTEAYRLAQAALTAEPLNPGALFVGAEAAYFSGNTHEVIALTNKLHSLPHPAFSLAHFLSAKALESQDRHSQAITEYEHFLAEDPNDPNASLARRRISELNIRTSNLTH
ncbi:MAG TPA: tetratricopeptide repeat protein [Terriglobales bacterium]|nr:tetratricopeptide repeat protein [Terriglobales bacterium]